MQYAATAVYKPGDSVNNTVYGERRGGAKRGLNTSSDTTGKYIFLILIPDTIGL